jgi:predicted Fe-Mo cluster-binding NifX family protein
MYQHMVRIAIPVVSPEGLASKVNDHFAMSESFAILEVKKGRIASAEVVCNARKDEVKAAEFIAEHGAEVVLAGRIGSCMTRIFMDKGVKVFSGAEGSAEDAFKDYKAGKLTEVRPNPYQI